MGGPAEGGPGEGAVLGKGGPGEGAVLGKGGPGEGRSWGRAPPLNHPSVGNFKDVRFYPIFIFGHFWAALSMISGFCPTRFFRQFWADPIFQLFEALFWPKRRPKILNFYPTRNFGHFWAALSKMSSFTPPEILAIFWAPSFVTLLIFRNVMTREHLNTLNTKTPKHLNT